jgi:hypothetical protein
MAAIGRGAVNSICVFGSVCERISQPSLAIFCRQQRGQGDPRCVQPLQCAAGSRDRTARGVGEAGPAQDIPGAQARKERALSQSLAVGFTPMRRIGPVLSVPLPGDMNRIASVARPPLRIALTDSSMNLLFVDNDHVVGHPVVLVGGLGSILHIGVGHINSSLDCTTGGWEDRGASWRRSDWFRYSTPVSLLQPSAMSCRPSLTPIRHAFWAFQWVQLQGSAKTTQWGFQWRQASRRRLSPERRGRQPCLATRLPGQRLMAKPLSEPDQGAHLPSVVPKLEPARDRAGAPTRRTESSRGKEVETRRPFSCRKSRTGNKDGERQRRPASLDAIIVSRC